jgi:hypothetical protein
VDDSVGSVAAATTSNGRNTEASAVPLLARWSRLFAATPQVDDDQGRVRAGASATSRTKQCSPQRRISQYRWTRTAVAPAPQPGLRKLRFDGWCIWGLSSQMRGVAVPGWAHWLTLAHCPGSSPPHHTWVLRHIGNGVISSRSVGLLDVRFTISTRSR